MYKRPRRQPKSGFLRPEKYLSKAKFFDRAAHSFFGFVFRPWRNSTKKYHTLLVDIHRYSHVLSGFDEPQLKSEASRLRAEFIREGCTDSLVAQSFALIREAAGRSLGMYHFDSQLLGGLVLFYGNIAEMHTGEGKTLTAILPAATAALASIPAHVITVNDYLAQRDADTMRPVYEMLGVSVGCVVAGKSLAERQQGYAADITYCTNKELVFDYLKDSLVLKSNRDPLQLHGERLKGHAEFSSQLMLRGLHFAVVDEADSVLLDEARTPLIISGEQKADAEQEKIYAEAIAIARNLTTPVHYIVRPESGAMELTAAGEQEVDAACKDLGPYWLGKIRRMELICKALMALHHFLLDHHYLIRDGKLQIIDEHTGRVMEDRTWELGLHQLIEAKEGCEFSKPRKTLARMSFQKFFRLYHHLGGMTGTAAEVMSELWTVYDLPVVPIPPHKVCQRRYLKCQSFITKEQKWCAVIDRIETLYGENRAVLVGTGSVNASEELSQRLSLLGIPYQLLSARHDEDEAEVVARAGQAAQITIATSMAGRGTDIKLSDEVERAGGLHVILTEYHDASRIDRQLLGRCARMGDPGSVETLVSLEDDILKRQGNTWLLLLKFFVLLSSNLSRVSNSFFLQRMNNQLRLKALRRAQYKIEKQHAKIRVQLLKEDESQQDLLSFVGSKM